MHSHTTIKKLRPFLKWAGNKYCCLNNIIPHMHPSTRLIEPFTGSGAIFMNSTYSQYLLAERNTDLINVYKQIQSGGEEFIAYCMRYFNGTNNKQIFYKLRALFNQHHCPKVRAALFVYLNRHGYNGLCRYNNDMVFNVPFGRYATPYFPGSEMLSFYSKSQNATFL